MAADPLDRIAEICHDQPHDALTQIAAVLGFPDPPQPTRRELDMAALIRQLCARIASHPELRSRAMDYLRREGLQGSPLRASGVLSSDESQRSGAVDG